MSSPPATLEDTNSGPFEIGINVILPTQSLQFCIHVTPASTVGHLKQRIYKECPGRPQVSGQRVIHKGRVLEDQMHLGDLFNATEGIHNVHLAVHPSAWEEPPSTITIPSPSLPSPTSTPRPFATSTRPSVHLAPNPSLLQPPTTSQPQTSLPTSPSFLSSIAPIHIPQQFIIHQHSNALRLLSRQQPQQWLGPGEFRAAKALTKSVLAASGFGWPQNGVFDTDLALDYQRGVAFGNELRGGVQYSWSVVDNLPYLSLSPESANSKPTPMQSRALEVLTYSFPLLPSLPTLPPYIPSLSLSVIQSAQGRGQRQRIIRLEAGALNQQNNGIGMGIAAERGFVPRRAQYPFHLELLMDFFGGILFLLANPSRILIPVSLVLLRATFILYVFGWAPSPALYTWMMGGAAKALGELESDSNGGSIWFWVVMIWAAWEIRSIWVREAGVELQRRNARAAARAAAVAQANDAAQAAPNPAADDQPVNPPGDAPAGAQQEQRPLPQIGIRDRRPRAAPNPVQPPAPNPLQPLPQQGPHPQDDAARVALMKVFDFLSKYRLGWERKQLGIDPPADSPQPHDPRAPPAPVDPRILREASTMERMSAFVVLLVISFVPDIWAKRVQHLKLREGRIREVYGRDWDEAADMEMLRAGPLAQPEGEQQQGEGEGQQGEGEGQQQDQQPPPNVELVRAARRIGLTGWRKDYVKRVIEGAGQEPDGM